jgi:hypothetical protein
MRKMIIFLVVVVALVVAMILLTREKPAPPAPAPAPVATPVRVAAPAAPRQPDSYQVLRPTPASTFVPVAPPGERVQQPAAAPAAAPSESKRAVMEAAAREAGVKIVSYGESGSSANVTVEWSSDIATQGADFIDALLKRGAIRDFDSTGRAGRSIRNGRSVWRAGFTVKW